MSRDDPTTTVPWCRAGTAALLGVVDALPALDGPSALPGWTRAHVVAHLARNAEALGRLVAWARTGVETPMYTGPGQRDADIARSVALPEAELRHQLRTTAAELAADLHALDTRQLQARVRTVQGRDIAAAQLLWMRVREVWLHAVDLDAGLEVDDLPADVVDTLLDDVTGLLGTREGCPALTLRASDRDRVWPLGGDGDGGPVEATGAAVVAPAASLLAWVTGRSGGPPAPLPTLPRWL